jgi:hypothetical protein
MRTRIAAVFVVLASVCIRVGKTPTAVADDPSVVRPVGEIPLREGLLLTGPVGSAARWPVRTDPVEAKVIGGT